MLHMLCSVQFLNYYGNTMVVTKSLAWQSWSDEFDPHTISRIQKYFFNISNDNSSTHSLPEEWMSVGVSLLGSLKSQGIS